MKVFKVREHFNERFNEYILGPRQIGSTGAYLAFGEVAAGGHQAVAAGAGHEEILLVVSGEGELRAGDETTPLKEGDAVYLGPDVKGEIRAAAGAPLRYVSAGGHLPGGHSH